MGPSSVDVLPSGNVAVATSPMTNNMAVFLVNQNPNPIVPPLIALPTPVPTGGNGPTSIDIGPDGVAAVALTSSGTSKTAQGFGAVALFRILPGGGLTPLGIVPTVGGSGPANVAVDPGGRFAYVSHQNSNNVSVVSIMPGSQQFVTTVPAGRSPRGVAIAP
jgi:DNA-binding beta-propeller fold protein YncE